LSPTVAQLVTHIQCEIFRARKQSGLENLTKRKYVSFAQLTVDVTNFQRTAPQLDFIHRYMTAMTNLTYTLGGQFTGTQHRNITQSFTIDLTQAKPGSDELCTKGTESDLLSGELGLDAVIADGLHQSVSDDFAVYPTPNNKKTLLNPTNLPVFGSTVDFTIVYGINNLGPTWTITHFKGPGGAGDGSGGGGSSSGAGGSGGGSAQGLLTMNRTVKDTLVISFAPACATDDCQEPAVEDFSLTDEALNPDTLAFDASLQDNIRTLTDQLNQFKAPAHATEAQRASIETTQALI
jgi:hypothetical protein